MPRRKISSSKWKDPVVIVGFTGIIALIAVTIGLALLFNTRQSQSNYQSAVQEHNDLIEKEKNLKPNVSSITTGKFDLQGQEKQLTKSYSVLVQAMFGDARSVSAVENAKGEYQKYFGEKGYKTMRNIALSGGSFVASQNTGTRVTFSNFNLSKKSIKVVIYSQFKLNSKVNSGNATQGIAYISTTYHFDKHYADNATVQSAFIDNDDDN